jgi:hypothetical protein
MIRKAIIHKAIIRKAIGLGALVIVMQVFVSAAFAQSTSGRSQGCFDSSGKHHNPGWCSAHGR